VPSSFLASNTTNQSQQSNTNKEFSATAIGVISYNTAYIRKQPETQQEIGHLSQMNTKVTT
jgi:hypothetical protein